MLLTLTSQHTTLRKYTCLLNLCFGCGQVDLGTNVGSFTMEAARRHLRVFAFEMQPLLYTALDLSLRASGYTSHVTLFHAALWDEDGVEVTFSSIDGNSGGTSIVPDVQQQNLKGKKLEETKMRTSRFDTLFKETYIYALKIGTHVSCPPVSCPPVSCLLSPVNCPMPLHHRHRGRGGTVDRGWKADASLV
jgi:FkbM family methyltransferase